LFFTCTSTSQAATAPAILSQESVHTTLSITHHTRKRPSTGPRTTHGPQQAGPRFRRLRGKEKEAVRWAAAGWFGGPAGLAGPKGKKGLFFFSFLFQTPFKTTFLFKFKSNSFKLFLQKILNYLETTQATKNHASQLMMHNHLVSLCLLNYV
jgi:hypothetical protein